MTTASPDDELLTACGVRNEYRWHERRAIAMESGATEQEATRLANVEQQQRATRNLKP